jgi:nucleolar complex protein 3
VDAQKLKQDLAEAESALDPKEVERINTEIVDCVFQCFFRLLKSNPLNLRVLPVVLRGISKYAHLISIDFMSDIIAVVRQLATASTTPPQLQIMCVSCVTTVLRNQGSAWSVDLKDFTSALYSTLFHSVVRSTPADAASDIYNPQEDRDQFSGLLTTLKTVLIDNRQLSLSRVDAFIKRCLLTATHAPQHIALALLAFSHALVLKYPKSSHLFSAESGAPPLPSPPHPGGFFCAQSQLISLLQSAKASFSCPSTSPTSATAPLCEHMSFVSLT